MPDTLSRSLLCFSFFNRISLTLRRMVIRLLALDPFSFLRGRPFSSRTAAQHHTSASTASSAAPATSHITPIRITLFADIFKPRNSRALPLESRIGQPSAF
jgi:hypothetical protein